ncbi:MAG TPA: cupin domain-containing protein [Pseudonocardiaceae bacterium]|jgi:mannose-6-phosphate isomerase-like protein (cupin superfamily)
MLTRADEAELLGAAPNQTWLLAEADDTDGTMNAVRTTLGRGVDGPPPHYHRASSELFFLLDGALDVLVGEEIVTVRTGDFLLVPPNTTHAWGTRAHAGADILIIKAPGTNRFDYFRLVDRVRKGEAAPQEILATQEKFDNHFVDSAAWRARPSAASSLVEPVVP